MPEVDSLRRSLLLGLAALGAGQAWAQPKGSVRAVAARWPQREVELTLPFPAGGTTSVLGKMLAKQFVQSTGQTLRLDYRGGAGGTVGASYVAKAPADGYHLLMGGSSLVISRAALPQLDVDLYEEFSPLALVAEMPLVLLVNPRKLTTRTWTETLAELRRRPQRYRFASAGTGSANHIAGEWLKLETGALMEHVPYKGSGPALLDVSSGNADVMLDGLASALPHLQADRLRAMFVTSRERSPLLPDVPTSSELGLADFQPMGWYGIFVPKATPADMQARMVEMCREMGASAALQKDLQAMGARWPALYGDDFARYVKQEMQRWAAIVRDTLGPVVPGRS